MQITVETYKIFLDQVICIFSHDEGFQDTLAQKMNVLSLGQIILINFIFTNLWQTSLILQLNSYIRFI